MCATHTTEHNNGWNRLGHGIHACSIFRDKDEQFSQITPFFSECLKEQEKCLYIVDENTPEEVSSNIAEANTSESAVNLKILSVNETYTKDGHFDPDNMVSFLREAIENSLEQGYSGIRGSAEMSWALSSDTSMETLLEYEQKLNDFDLSDKLTSVCQYNEKKFSPEFLIEMIRTHPYIIVRGKLYQNKYFYTDPEFANESLHHFGSGDYETVLSIFTDEQPIWP